MARPADDSAPRPVLVVTGAAAAGKSTVGAGLVGRPDLLVLDGDVLASGAAAVADGRGDYEAFWRYLLDLADEVQRSDLTPVFTCICRPAQLLAAPALDRFSGVHFLALVASRAELERRILGRAGDASSISRLAFHLDFDELLRTDRVRPPHTFTVLETTGASPEQTLANAFDWTARLAP